MKVLLFNGSPRKSGCTNRALTEVSKALELQGIESEIIWIGSTVQGCIACGKCHETGKCVFKDIVNEVSEKVKVADGFIFGTPVYYGNGSGQITSFMDRLFYSSHRYFENKVAATVVSCRRGGASESFAQLNMYYMMNNMIVASSQYWNQVHGNTVEEVEQDLEGLQTMRTLGNNVAYILKCLEAGKQNGVNPPQKEKLIRTNFIR